MNEVPLNEDVLILRRLDGFTGTEANRVVGAGYISDRPLKGFKPETFYVHRRAPNTVHAEQQAPAVGRYGHAIEISMNAGGIPWRWCFGGPVDDVMFDVSYAPGAQSTTIQVSREHFLEVGDYVAFTKGRPSSGSPGFWDRLHEVTEIVNPRAFKIRFGNEVRVQDVSASVPIIAAVPLGAFITGVTAANPAVVTTSAPHGITSGQTVWHYTNGATGPAAGFFDTEYVATVLTPTTYSIPFDNSAGATTSGGFPFASIKRTLISVTRPKHNEDNRRLAAHVGAQFLISFSEVLTGITNGIALNHPYTAVLLADNGAQLTFEIAAPTQGTYLSGGKFAVNYDPIGWVNGGRQILNHQHGYGRGIQSALFWRAPGRRWTFSNVVPGATTKVALNEDHGMSHGDYIQCVVTGDTGTPTLNITEFGGGANLAHASVWQANHRPTFAITDVTKASPCVVTVATDLSAYLGIKVGERFEALILGSSEGVDAPHKIDTFHEGELLTAGAGESTFALRYVNTTGAVGDYATDTGTLTIYSRRCLVSNVDTSAGSGYTTGVIEGAQVGNPNQGGGAQAGPATMFAGHGEEMGSPCYEFSARQSGDSFVIEAWCWPLEWTHDGAQQAEGWTHFGTDSRAVLYPFFRMGYRLTLNYQGINGLHQWTTLIDTDRVIKPYYFPDGTISKLPGVHCPILHMRYGLGSSTIEPKLYAMNVVRPDLGIGGFQLLTGVEVPGSVGPLIYDGPESGGASLSGTAIGIGGQHLTDDSPPSSPLYPLSGDVAIASFSNTANPGLLTVTLAGPHGMATGVKFRATIDSVTGAPDINGNHLVTAVSSTAFTLKAGAGGSFSGGSVSVYLQAGGIILASGETPAKHAVGLYSVAADPTAGLAFNNPLTRGVGNYGWGKVKDSNTTSEAANDLVHLSTNVDRESWPAGKHEHSSYITMYRDGVTFDAAALCAAAMLVAYQRGLE